MGWVVGLRHGTMDFNGLRPFWDLTCSLEPAAHVRIGIGDFDPDLEN